MILLRYSRAYGLRSPQKIGPLFFANMKRPTLVVKATCDVEECDSSEGANTQYMPKADSRGDLKTLDHHRKILSTALRLSSLTHPMSQSWRPQSRLLHSSCVTIDPFKLRSSDLKHLYDDIRKLIGAQELFMSTQELRDMCEYYFDGKGKALRPMIVILMAVACNAHHNNSREVQPAQRAISVFAEMMHTATLVHDDVIDGSDLRRGKKTINQIWGEKKAALAGDFLVSVALMALARVRNLAVISVTFPIIEDLVRGEFLQLGSKENENERFSHYLEKTFKKTASLIANSCKAVSILACPDPKVHEIAYQYGRNVGMAFQLIDDVLDFTCADQLGKPTDADLKLGLATGPVLFACHQFPELNTMIMTRFSSPGDVERARQYVNQSDGIHQTTYLAQRYCNEAIREISKLQPSPERDALIQLTETVITRDK